MPRSFIRRAITKAATFQAGLLTRLSVAATTDNLLAVTQWLSGEKSNGTYKLLSEPYSGGDRAGVSPASLLP